MLYARPRLTIPYPGSLSLNLVCSGTKVLLKAPPKYRPPDMVYVIRGGIITTVQAFLKHRYLP